MFFFYNNKKPRQFNYKPILYNPDKDEFNERVAKVKKEMGVIKDEEFKPTIKGEFIRNTDHVRRKVKKDEGSPKKNTMKNTKLIIFLVVLIVIGYIMYFN